MRRLSKDAAFREGLARRIEALSGVTAPSCAEDAMIRVVRRSFSELGLDPHVDRLGNVIAVIPGRVRGGGADAGAGHARPVMITAHMDEVGFVVRRITDDGFLRLHRSGGIHDRVVAGQTLAFLGENGPVTGVVGVKSKHLSTPDELGRSVSVDEAYVDVMANGAADVREELGIEVGTLGTYEAGFARRGDVIRGKAFDDRIGVAMLIALAQMLVERPADVPVALVATVQEEFSVRGGVTAARALRPELALCLDIAMATDTPDLAATEEPVRLGGGPVITAWSRAGRNGIVPNPKLRRALLETARGSAIPVQHAVLQGGLTDGSYMQYEGEGIPTLDVGFPIRYAHTPVETADLRDVAGAIDLVSAFVYSLSGDLDLQRG